MEAFGILDILQKGLQTSLSIFKGVILVQIDLLTLHRLDEAFGKGVFGG